MVSIHSGSDEHAGWHMPFWGDYRALLAELDGPAPPGPEQLNRLLPADAVSGGGKPLRFVAAAELPGVAYERHIFETGEVSTRQDNWHDLFNALAWCRLPRLKAAMNALHYAHLSEERDGRRGPRRDALTLLDESGALVVSSSRARLEALASRDWPRAFTGCGAPWSADTRVVVCGHALLEKFLLPYKAITAHALLLCAERMDPVMAGDGFLRRLDRAVAGRLLEGSICGSPAALSPVPVMGIPGWWEEPQDAAFYGDGSVFRVSRGLDAAPVHDLWGP